MIKKFLQHKLMIFLQHKLMIYYLDFNQISDRIINLNSVSVLRSQIIISSAAMKQSQKTNKHNFEKISEIFQNKTISAFLRKQLEEMILNYEENYQFILSVEANHLLVYFHSIFNKRSDTTDTSSSQNIQSQPFRYIIRITKGFPVYGLRLHILKCSNLQPKINDCRDLLYEILGDTWNYQRNLSQIIAKIPNFQQKIFTRNQNYLRMQQTGQFQLGDIYDPLEFKKFESMETFQNFCPDSEKMILATTETHLLIFKHNTKPTHKKNYFLSIASQLQCLHSIQRDQNDNSVKLILLKYKKVKNFYEYDKINLKFVVHEQEHEKLMRNILKYITKFKKVQVNLQLSSLWRNQENFEGIDKKIKQCDEIQEMLEIVRGEDRNLALKKLSKNYQKIIEYFSARANCYYLIYVNKLNNIFLNNKELRN